MRLTDQLFQLLHDLGHLQIEILLIAGACLVLVVGLFKVPNWVIKYTVAAVLITLLFSINEGAQTLFESKVISSHLSWAMVRICVLTVLFLLIFPTSVNQRSSYYFIMLIVLLGAIWMMHARHLLLIYLAIEMVSYGAYLLTNFSLNRTSHEAALKYLLFGGVSSAIMLFGISMIYGANGHLLLTALDTNTTYAQMGGILFLIGVFFKIGVVPFHTWIPNVYQSAPADAAAFFSIVPKLAGLILLQNVLSLWDWAYWLVLSLGMLSILLGTFGAIRQTNVRRLISYGAIAHTGLLLPFVLWPIGQEAFVWYAAIYAFVNISVFLIVNYFENQGVVSLQQYGGLGKNQPLPGVSFTVIVLALIGLPPTIGFTAKWLLFSGIWNQFLLDGLQSSLVYLLIAIFATGVAVYYYLRPSFYLFIAEGTDKKTNFPISHSLILAVISLIIIGLFVYPDLLRWLY